MTVALVPEGSFRVTTSWRTNVIQAWDGTEQRISTMSTPRARYDTSFFLDDAAYRDVVQALAAGPAGTYELPLLHEAVAALAPVTTTLVVSATYAEWLAIGRRVLVVGPAGHKFRDTVTAVAGGTLTIGTGPSSGYYPAGVTMVYPLESISLEEGQVLSRYAVRASRWRVVGRAQPRAVLGTGATLTTFDSLPVLDRRPLLDSTAPEQVPGGVEFLDLGGAFTSSRMWSRSQWQRGGVWNVRGPAERQWWKLLAATLHGRWKPFLFPSWRPDLTLYEQPSASGIAIRVVEGYAADWYPSLAHRRVQLEYADGTVGYFTVTGATHTGSYDQLAVTPSLPGSIPGGSVSRVSFLETARLMGDDLTIEYSGGWQGRVALGAVVVQE